MKDSSDQAANKWNVPEWSEPSQYPDPTKASDTQWRWEFLRRSAEYRHDWEICQQDTRPFKIAIEGDPDELVGPPFYAEENEHQWERIWRFLRKYGLGRLFDPSVSTPRHLKFYFVPFAADPSDNPDWNNAGIDMRSIPWQLRYPYLAWFDLSKPLTPQLNHYVEVLHREQAVALDRQASILRGDTNEEIADIPEIEEKEEKSFLAHERKKIYSEAVDGKALDEREVRPPTKRNKKSERKQWSKFLRVLDARAMTEPTSWRKIGKEVYSNKADPSTQARMAFKSAQGLWRKIDIERESGQNILYKAHRMQDVDYSLPPVKPLLMEWLDLLPPRLQSLMINSL